MRVCCSATSAFAASERRRVRRARSRTVGPCGPPLPHGEVSRQSRRWHPAHYAYSSALVRIRGLAPLSAACRAAVLLLDDAASVSYLLARFIPRQGLLPDRPGQMSPAQEDGGDPEWWTWSGSNRQPSPCEGDALPVAPQAQMVAVAGLEP